MRRLIVGLVVGIAIGVVSTSFASSGRIFYLNRGDAAVSNGGETVCDASPHGGSRLGFICKVGGDYRARYGVIVNEKEVAITRYSGFSHYRVIVHRLQNPVR
jgi:hypothetical protein